MIDGQSMVIDKSYIKNWPKAEKEIEKDPKKAFKD